MRHCFLLLLIACSNHVRAQEIIFDPTPQLAESRYTATTPRLYGHCADSLIVDTVYTENRITRSMDMVLQTYPLSRYEFYADGGLYRRIDIVQEKVPAQGSKKDKHSIVEGNVRDIPNGAYHEFFPNGNIRIKGTLAGYNADGSLKKTGEWSEWDAQEKVIRKETYP